LGTIDIGYPQVFGIDKGDLIGTDGRLRQHAGVLNIDTKKNDRNEYLKCYQQLGKSELFHGLVFFDL